MNTAIPRTNNDFFKEPPWYCNVYTKPYKTALYMYVFSSRQIFQYSALLNSRTQVARFKGFVIGGGGLLESRHWPLDCEAFVAGLGDELPVAIFAVGAR